MTTIRQRRANGANAKASTGPKTKAGKARSAQNALRHGLTISVWSEPALAPQAEAIALRIAGPNAEANALEWARRIGEAQVDLDRVGALRREAIIRMMSDSHKSLGDMQTTRHTFLNRLDCTAANHVGIEMIKQLTDPPSPEGDIELARILSIDGNELARLDRYERRALSRRKTAIRNFDACRALEPSGSSFS